MINKLQIVTSDAASTSYLRNKLISFNMEQVSRPGKIELVPYVTVLKDEHDAIFGGIEATLIHYWKRCHINTFWIDPLYRGHGYGKKLLADFENAVRTQGVYLIQLETYSFQAPQFYLQQGYQIIGIIEDHPEGHTQYFMKKQLQ